MSGRWRTRRVGLVSGVQVCLVVIAKDNERECQKKKASASRVGSVGRHCSNLSLVIHMTRLGASKEGTLSASLFRVVEGGGSSLIPWLYRALSPKLTFFELHPHHLISKEQ